MANEGYSEREALADFQRALQLHQLGFLAAAGEIYARVLARLPNSKAPLYFRTRLRHTLAAGHTNIPWRVIWQLDPDPAQTWEQEWLEYLLAEVPRLDQVVDTKHSLYHQNMIVIDKGLSAVAEGYYAQAAIRGCNVILFHLSDEAYADDCASYAWCNLVFRNYWSFVHADSAKLVFFPLGYKTGFWRDGSDTRTANERQYLWSFMGDAKKSSRPAMLDSLSGIGKSFVHLTSGFNTSDALPTRSYREILDDSIVVPCPAGWQNLDSFRVWEALEAGCIPIVERREKFDYFAALCHGHPFPTVNDWKQAVEILNRDLEALETLRSQCMKWWQTYKGDLKARITASILGTMQPVHAGT